MCNNCDQLYDNNGKNNDSLIKKGICGKPYHGIKDEILCHFPYAILSVSLAMILLSLFSFSGEKAVNTELTYKLFHNFHYLHLLFAGTGTVLMFRKYSKNNILCLIMGLFVPLFFCTISDAFLPYIGGKIIGLNMDFHWCIISHLSSILPFLITGIINGWVMSSHSSSQIIFYSTGSHFFHIFISSMASILYLVSFGFNEWWDTIGFVFLYIIAVVMIPCIFADIVIPILFAQLKTK